MSKYDKILKQVLNEIKPDKELPEVKRFVNKLNKQLKNNKVKAKAVLGGSFAKGTWLKEDHDVDIFAAFDLKYKNEDLSRMLEKALKQWTPLRVKGSRDYFQIRNKIQYEIIPVLAIKKPSDAENVTDFSIWHVDWANKHGKKLKEDIMLLKKFCKVQRVYGAESYINGLSGHTVDLLTIHYGGFLGALKEATKWKPKVVLDPGKRYKGKKTEQVLTELNASKTTGPLVLIDPVQPQRNAASALQQECFEKFIATAKKFLEKPSIEFFRTKKVDFEKLKKKGKLIVLEAVPHLGNKDIAGTKMIKAHEYLERKLEDFGILEAGWEWQDKALLWYVVKERKLSKTTIQEGPPLRMKEAVEAFKKAHKKTFTKKGKVLAVVERRWNTSEEAIKELIKDEYVKERVRGIKIV